MLAGFRPARHAENTLYQGAGFAWGTVGLTSPGDDPQKVVDVKRWGQPIERGRQDDRDLIERVELREFDQLAVIRAGLVTHIALWRRPARGEGGALRGEHLRDRDPFRLLHDENPSRWWEHRLDLFNDRAWMAVRQSPILQALRSRSRTSGQVSRRLRAFREEADFTQEQLAQRAQVATNTISEIENGHLNPSIAVLARLVELGLEMPLAAFFGADKPGELRDDLAKLEALFAAQSAVMRRRALRVLKALCDE